MEKEVICGIYKITSPTGRIYIGESKDIYLRWGIYTQMNGNTKSQRKLWRSFKKYGVEKHIFEIIEECVFEELLCKERYWQDFYDVLNGGLNCKLTECREQKQILSEESRLKISESNSGKIKTEDNKQKISESLKTFYKENEHPMKGIKRGTINNKLVESQVIKIRELLLEGKTVVEISKLFVVSKATIQQIKEGRTWQSLGEFKLEGKASRLKKEDLELLFKLFDIKTKVKDIQKILPYCTTTIAKQRKIWKQTKKDSD